MSASAYKLLLYLCVWTSILKANAIQKLRYPTRLEKNWRFGKRQDLLTKSRFFMWNPALGPPQMYSNIKTPLNPHNFNRYSIPPPPAMAAIHHQNYMFALPTKMNYPAFAQPVKEIDEKRKPGNLHHITIINAILPKPYLPTAPTHSFHHPTSTFRNYRTNNKLLYTQQYFNNNFARQNVENLNKLANQHVQLQHLQQHQPQPLQMVYTSSPLAVKMNTPTMEYMNVINYNTKNNDYEENEISNTVTKCGRKTKEDSNNSASDVLYYYCNNRITNYKNPTQQQQQQLFNIPPSTTTTSTSTSTTTTTEAPTTTTTRTTVKSLDIDLNLFTTEKPVIFLPTPNAPLENGFTPIASAFRSKNSLNGLENNDDDNFKPQRQKSRFNKYEDIRPEIQQQRQRQRKTLNSYDNIKRQQHYTTSAAPAYDNMKLHSFFTIEDAVTRAPEMQVFNDPYQAYRHARRHHNNKHLRQTITTTTTTTKEPYTTAFTTKPKFKSFFDELDEDEYILQENTAQYDYPLYNKPEKSAYFKADHNTEKTFSKPNQILDHTYKTAVDNSFFNEGDVYLGKPKIKEHHFDLFKALAPTSIPAITTYKPNNSRDFFLTTPKVTSSFTYNSKPISFTTTTEAILRNPQGITETENTTSNNKSNEISTTTIIPIATTTAKKSNRVSLKSPLNLRSSNPFKYTKPRGIQKSYKNLNFTTTTTKATPTLKKVTKYQRQYKGKKLKQFKHLYTTTSTSSTTTTTTEIPTTEETATKRQTLRLIPTTTSTTTEEPTTKNINNSRIIATTDTIKIKKSRQSITISTEAPIRNKIKNTRTSTTSSTIINNPNSSTKRPSHRRGTKRTNIARNNKETKSTLRKTENKSRRRLSVSSSSTTPKPYLIRPTSSITSTSTTSTTTSPPLRKSSSTTTTTTMKSIMRIANSKSRSKINNEIKTPIKLLSNEVNDERLFSRTTISSTMASIPPLPIEIYFKKSHNAKI